MRHFDEPRAALDDPRARAVRLGEAVAAFARLVESIEETPEHGRVSVLRAELIRLEELLKGLAE